MLSVYFAQLHTLAFFWPLTFKNSKHISNSKKIENFVAKIANMIFMFMKRTLLNFD